MTRSPSRTDFASVVAHQVAVLAPEAERLLVAVSGGPDSVALLRILIEADLNVEVAHFDHALRPDSAEDARFVAALGARLGVPYHHQRSEVAQIAAAKGWNLEDAARRLRYSFLTRTAKRIGTDVVVTGHTKNDQAETVLMQLVRGAAFLRGMAARRQQLIRPLLGVTREELLSYLDEIGETYRSDATNLDRTRTRAWVRLEPLPLLRRRYPALLTTLAKLATLQQDHADHFSALSQTLLAKNATGVSTRQLAQHDVATQRYVLAELLRRADLAPDFGHLETLRSELTRPTPTRISLPGDKQARIAYGRLDIVPTSGVSAPPERPATTLPADVDASKAAAFAPLVYRARRPGDTIRLPGGRKKLSDLLIDRKIPREDRDYLSVLASGSEVLWIKNVATDVRVAALKHDLEADWMRAALEQAHEAGERGELPVGAVVVRAGEIVAVGSNSSEADHDPTAHAEMHALRAAARVVGDWRLTDCTLVVTLEPCPMCFGAMLQAHLRRVVYGAPNYREGALGTVSDLRAAGWKRTLEVRGGVLEPQARALLRDFFQARRSPKDNTD
ncbi:MAG: tRNA lysidine(34) synthetase TilS [Trueperaceae bacterium]|nr:tRNA lysidine(34) synthetase TilS [Trueperaceae bacterium]